MLSINDLPSIESLLESLGSGELLRLVNTKEAAKILNVCESTLASLRVRGGGPRFIKRGAQVLYVVVELYRWAFAGGLKSSSSDPGTPIQMPALVQPVNDNTPAPKGLAG